MEVKQNPFSFYDFLGYFVPGSLFVYLLISVGSHTTIRESTLIKFINLSDLKGIELYTPLILLAYISGHLINFLSAITVEKHLNWMYGFPSKTLLGFYQNNYFTTGNESIKKNIIRSIIALLLIPISAIDFFFNYVLGIKNLLNKELDPLMKEITKQKIALIMSNSSGLKSPPTEPITETNYFLFIYHYALENSKNHAPKMQNYVALFGLMRTLTLYLVILFWVAAWHLSYSQAEPQSIIITLITLSTLSYIFYLSFIKFYRRFTLEALMAAIVAPPPI
ncbi:hypothetical protein HRH33_08850 [Pseudomonas rhodesiae]|uniref:hypothetical protein n=1 Tax=Pseudomonas rhodesiae TaxID=76760 RepID=UPI00156B8102|nr:hypothetical protein [Pseudomonas rhodesiae]QKJ72680.1 hypothetical protein HRH33_08850 [Pseudomonas rhodesiae]